MDQRHATDAQYQDRVRNLERRRERQHAEDLRWFMAQPAALRVAYRWIYELGRLEAASFEPAIRDGVMAFGLTARNEGIRELAASIKEEMQRANPGNWVRMIEEEIRAREADLALRKQAESAGEEST